MDGIVFPWSRKSVVCGTGHCCLRSALLSQDLSIIPSPLRERVRVRVKSSQVANLSAARKLSQNY